MNRRLFNLTLIAGAFALPLAYSSAEAAGKKGSFKADKSRYQVSGTATVNGDKITLSGFKTSRGPDLYVYLGNGKATQKVALLKANSGNQTYTFKGASKYSTVHIHCKRFSVTFGTARLK